MIIEVILGSEEFAKQGMTSCYINYLIKMLLMQINLMYF